MAFIISCVNKPIVFALILMSPLLISTNVEARPGKVMKGLAVAAAATIAAQKINPALERLCFSAEFPHECASGLTPFMGSGDVNAHTVLQAGLKLLAERSKKALEQAEKLKQESKAPEESGHLNMCLEKYKAIGESTKGAADALPAREFNKLESQLDCMVSDIDKCEEALARSSSEGKPGGPLQDLNMSLKMAAKNNLNIGNFVAMPNAS